MARTEETGLPLVPGAWRGLAAGPRRDLAAVSPDDRAALVGMRPRYADVVVIALGAAEPEVPGVRVLRAVTAQDAIRQWQAGIGS